MVSYKEGEFLLVHNSPNPVSPQKITRMRTGLILEKKDQVFFFKDFIANVQLYLQFS